jgi:hypothetical protein
MLRMEIKLPLETVKGTEWARVVAQVWAKTARAVVPQEAWVERLRRVWVAVKAFPRVVDRRPNPTQGA